MYIQSNVVSQWNLDSTMTAHGTRQDSDAVQRLRRGTQFKTNEIDGCFLAATGSKTVLTWPELTLTITGSGTLTHLMLYSPEHAMCVEPQTSTIDAAQLEERGITDTGHVLVNQTHPLIATTTWSWDG
jgi:galactose mutarotase-like enzyme